jgi:2'-5' RNA ligase
VQTLLSLDPHLTGLRWLTAEQLHLTLSFLGDVGAPLIQLRSELLAKGVLGKNEKGSLALLQDYEFSSPSTAAGIIRGASSNGRSEWRTGEGKKLREIQDEQIPKG